MEADASAVTGAKDCQETEAGSVDGVLEAVPQAKALTVDTATGLSSRCHVLISQNSLLLKLLKGLMPFLEDLDALRFLGFLGCSQFSNA